MAIGHSVSIVSGMQLSLYNVAAFSWQVSGNQLYIVQSMYSLWSSTAYMWWQKVTPGCVSCTLVCRSIEVRMMDFLFFIGKGKATKALGPVDGTPIRVLPVGSGDRVSVETLLSDKVSDGASDKADTVKSPSPKRASLDADLVFINEGLPPLPAKIVLKIEKGDYVDFRDLLPQKPSMDDSALTELEEQGIVVVTASKQVRPQKKQIQDLATWIEAFLTFVAIRTRKQPELTDDLMAYGTLIARGARDYRGSGWLSYDFQFRHLAAARGKTTKWGEKDVSLWNETVCKPEWSATASTSSLLDDRKGQKRKGPTLSPPGGKKKAKPRESWKSAICFPFSYTGKCTREGCSYLHVCFDCGEGHSQVSCPKKRQ